MLAIPTGIAVLYALHPHSPHDPSILHLLFRGVSPSPWFCQSKVVGCYFIPVGAEDAVSLSRLANGSAALQMLAIPTGIAVLCALHTHCPNDS